MDSIDILNLLRTQLNSVYPLPEESVVALYNQMTEISLRKKELLLNANDRNNNIYFLVSGLMRVYTIIDGVERIADFIKPGYFVNILSQTSFIPTSKACVEAMEQCVVLSINNKELESLYETSVELANWGRVYSEKEVNQFNHFFSHLYFLSPEKLYEEAIRTLSPQLLQKIPLKYLASYLNRTPESLSRIRKRIVNKETK